MKKAQKIKLIKFLSLAFLIALAFGCIEEFNPEINESADLLVVQGSIIKGDTVQIVEISRSSPYDAPKEQPVSGCFVRVIDGNGTSHPFREESSGSYTAEIPQQYLQFNSKFKLRITTADDKEYESEMETIFEGSPVDSVYFLKEPYQSSSVYYENGLQFYLDLKAPNQLTRNYRWTIDETWEYHSKYAINATWDNENGILTEKYTVEYFFCWKTASISGFYSASTENLVVNEKKKIPLHYVPVTDAKLAFGYSGLVKQYTLSDKAFEYWNRNKVESSESGGLYQTQPSQSRSNIYNINDPDEIVLGFFWASSSTEKRVFSKGDYLPNSRNSNASCEADTIDIVDVGVSIFNPYYAKILDRPDTVIWGTANEVCFDCRLRGGTNIKPNFWIY